jgi:hypothetical protein
MALQEKPSLIKEIAKVAWLMAKVLGCYALFIIVPFSLFRRNPIVGYVIFCSLLFVGAIVFLGWESYTLKKRDWERQQGTKGSDCSAKDGRWRRDNQI